MRRIGISEKEPRQTEGRERVKSKDLKVVDAASLLRVRRIILIPYGKGLPFVI
jgi:hypothetical protein